MTPINRLLFRQVLGSCPTPGRSWRSRSGNMRDARCSTTHSRLPFALFGWVDHQTLGAGGGRGVSDFNFIHATLRRVNPKKRLVSLRVSVRNNRLLHTLQIFGGRFSLGNEHNVSPARTFDGLTKSLCLFFVCYPFSHWIDEQML